MTQPTRGSQWEALLSEAYRIIDHVNRDHEILTSWTFGGGTAMMLQINHRESHDIDLFLDDPQLLPYVAAAVSDLAFKIGEPVYGGDGTGHLKVSFDEIGEIDFIVAGPVTDEYATTREIEGRIIALETISEIVAKKIRVRGASTQPRDVFDIAAASRAGYDDEINAVLSEIPEFKSRAAEALDKLSPDYVRGNVSQLIQKPGFKDLVDDALEVT